MLSIRTSPLLPSIPPVRPDFYICDQRYGLNVSPLDCNVAGRALPEGMSEVPYVVGGGAALALPVSIQHGTCMISVEVAGPNLVHTYMTAPTEIRGMAGLLQTECVTPTGRGGFITKDIRNLLNFVTSSTASVRLLNNYPPPTSFLTVTITNSRSNPSPGNTDPSIAQTLADAVREAWSRTLSSSPMRQLLAKRSSFYVSQSMKMRTGGNLPWWWSRANLPEKNEMTYKCDDPKLGHPKEVDCAHIEWEELGADADVLELLPGVVKTLTSNSCHVAIGAAIAMTLSWAQIRTALDTLLNICVRHPFLTARGGRAFNGKQPIRVSGKVRRNEDLTGLNALPVGVNLTVSSSPTTGR